MESSSNAWIDFTITRGPIRGKDRNRIGLIVRLQARRDVEEFLSGLAQGRRIAMDAIADAWYNCGSDSNPLEIYDVDTHSVDARGYSLDHAGGALLINRNDGRLRAVAPADDLVNLSFLKLVGISSEGGVSIGLVGAYSSEYIKRVRNLMPSAIKQFLQDYLVPITVNLQVISRSE